MSAIEDVSAAPGAITVAQIPGLARWTVSEDREHYVAQQRPVSFQRLVASSWPSLRRPIFVLGAPRSGTTFLGACLGELPQVSYHFEPVATKAAARCVYEGTWGRRRSAFFFREVYRWLLRLHGDGDLRFAEKTPQNCFILEFLAEVFPDSQFVHIVRDGRDAAISYRREPWLQANAAASGVREPGGYLFGPYARFWVEPYRVAEFESTSDLHRCIWGWRRFTEEALGASRGLPASRYHEIRYEDLVRDPRATGRGVLDFLGIDGDVDASMRAFVRARTDSVGRWADELSEAEMGVIEREAGPLLRRLGYAT